MSSNELAERIMVQIIACVATPEQRVLPDTPHPTGEAAMAEKSYNLTEFVGIAIGNTLGLVIANVSAALLEVMKPEERYRSIGILGARTGTGPHVMAADETVKVTNAEVVSIELPHDAKGGADRGSLIVLGESDVSDVEHRIEVTLEELDRTFDDVYGDEANHIELQYTAHASYALEKASSAPPGRACGTIADMSASVGAPMADTVLKSTNVEVVAYSLPTHSTSFSNETILVVSGGSDVMRQAVISAREIGRTILGTLDAEPKNDRPSYI